jgi:hypothetical protein
MTKPKQDAPEVELTEPAPSTPRFVLKKNHGLTIRGRAHRHFTAGTEFDPAKDGEVISQLAQSGAIFE